jgi:hypothetical protein
MIVARTSNGTVKVLTTTTDDDDDDDDDDARVWTIGRRADADVYAGEGDATTSRTHCAVRATARGAVEVRDCGSTHGTRMEVEREGGDGVATELRDVGVEWVKVCDGRRASRTRLVLGKGATTVDIIVKDGDDGSATEPDMDDDGSATEPDNAHDSTGISRHEMKTTRIALGETLTRRGKRPPTEPTLGEAECVVTDLIMPRRRVDVWVAFLNRATAYTSERRLKRSARSAR